MIAQARFASEGEWPFGVATGWSPDTDRIVNLPHTLLPPSGGFAHKTLDSNIHEWGEPGARKHQQVRFLAALGPTHTETLQALFSEARRGIVWGTGDAMGGSSKEPHGFIAQLREAGRARTLNGPLGNADCMRLLQECSAVAPIASKGSVLTANYELRNQRGFSANLILMPEMTDTNCVVIGHFGAESCEVGTLLFIKAETKRRQPAYYEGREVTGYPDGGYPSDEPPPIAMVWYGTVAVYRPEAFIVLDGCTGIAP